MTETNKKTVTLTDKELDYIFQGLLLAEESAQRLADSSLGATRCAIIENLREKLNDTPYDVK